MTQPTPDSLDADKEVLRKARKLFGSNRGWKQAIWTAWLDGDYATPGLSDIAGVLQAIRNRRGPAWLHAVRIGKERPCSR
jgi:hypothetical protein